MRNSRIFRTFVEELIEGGTHEKLLQIRVSGCCRREYENLWPLVEPAERTVESVGRHAQKPTAASRGGGVDLQAVWD